MSAAGAVSRGRMGRASCHRAGGAYLLAGCVRRRLSQRGRTRARMHSLSVDQAPVAKGRTRAREHRGFRTLHRACGGCKDERDERQSCPRCASSTNTPLLRHGFRGKIPAHGTDLLGPSCGFSRACRPEGIARGFHHRDRRAPRRFPRFKRRNVGTWPCFSSCDLRAFVVSFCFPKKQKDRTQRSFAESEFRFSVQPEIHFHADIDGHWLAILYGRVKTPIPHCLDSFFVEPKSEAAQHLHVTRTSVGPHDQPQHDHALIFRLARFLRIFRIGLEDCPGGRDSAADVKHASTDTTALAWPDSGTFSRTYAAAGARSNAAARTSSVR